MSIKFADMTELLRRERIESVMKCERSVITMTLLRLDYLVHGLGNCADDTRMKPSPSMHSFAAVFHRYAIIFNCWLILMIKYTIWSIEIDECVLMKLKCSQWSFIPISWHLVTVHTKFHPHETLLFSFFLNFMPCHQLCICGMSFNENETHMKLTLRMVVRSSPYCHGCQISLGGVFVH